MTGGIADEAEINVGSRTSSIPFTLPISPDPFDVSDLPAQTFHRRGGGWDGTRLSRLLPAHERQPHAKQAPKLESGVPCRPRRSVERRRTDRCSVELPNATRKCIFKQRGRFAASTERPTSDRNADVPGKRDFELVADVRSQPKSTSLFTRLEVIFALRP